MFTVICFRGFVMTKEVMLTGDTGQSVMDSSDARGLSGGSKRSGSGRNRTGKRDRTSILVSQVERYPIVGLAADDAHLEASWEDGERTGDGDGTGTDELTACRAAIGIF